MRRLITGTLFMGGLLAVSWYGAFGETGPMGWLNAMQAKNSGSYSRPFSFFILFIASVLIAALLLAIWVVIRDKLRGGAPAPAPRPPAPSWKYIGWRTGLAGWIAAMMLVWAGTLAWHARDWRQRVSDADSDYPPLRLSREVTPARPTDGSHLTLQGHLLWDHALVRRSSNSSTEPDVVFLPLVGADWHAGDAVHFVAQLDRDQTDQLHYRPPSAEAPLRVRVEGTIPGATRPVFQQGESPVSDVAVLVHVVDAPVGQPADAHPVFDWHSTALIGGVLSAVLVLFWVTAALALKVDARRQRRRQVR